VINTIKRRGILASALMLGATLMVSTGVGPFAPQAAFAALGAGGEYQPVTPSRVLDTRQPNSVPSGLRGFGTSNGFDVKIAGATPLTGGAAVVPAANVLAVVANITVTGTSAPGYLTAFPSGGSLPNASNVNFNAGENVPNLAILRPGAGGSVRFVLTSSNGQPATGHVIVDIVGWFSTSASPTRGSRLVSLGPGRILDSRSNVARSGPLGATQSFRLQIRGADAVGPVRADYIPDSPSVSAVVLNITATAPTSDTFIAVQPGDFSGFPSTSSLNLSAGQTKANLVIVPVGVDGGIRLFNERGSVQLIADVVGYFKSGVNDETRAGRVVPLDAPFRAADTRDPALGGPAKLGSGQAEDWDFGQFVQGVKVGGVWIGEQDTLLANLTATDLSFPYQTARSDTFLTLYPGGTTLPDSSNLNLLPGRAVPNLSVLRLSDANKLTVYNDNGFVHYIIDVAAVVLQD
jgi:hypothetical protein